MNKLLIAVAWSLGVGPALAGGPAAHADSGHTLYRQVVLEGTPVTTAGVPNGSRVGDSRVLAPYAQYLVYLGMSRDDAIARAEQSGERAARADRPVAVEQPQFSFHELYQRTVLGRSENEILRDRQSSARRLARAGAGAN